MNTDTTLSRIFSLKTLTAALVAGALAAAVEMGVLKALPGDHAPTAEAVSVPPPLFPAPPPPSAATAAPATGVPATPTATNPAPAPDTSQSAAANVEGWEKQLKYWTDQDTNAKAELEKLEKTPTSPAQAKQAAKLKADQMHASLILASNAHTHAQELVAAESAAKAKQKKEAENDQNAPAWLWRFLSFMCVNSALALVVIAYPGLGKFGPPFQQLVAFLEMLGIRDAREKIETAPLEQRLAVAKAEVENNLTRGRDAVIRRMRQLKTGVERGANDRSCRVLLLGNGSTGKTHFLYTILGYRGTHCDKPLPGEKTIEEVDYYLLHQVAFTDEAECCIFQITDYRGQFTLQRVMDTALQRKDDGNRIDVFLLVVDLFQTDSKASPGSPLAAPYRPAFDRKKIQSELKYWTEDRLAVAFNVNRADGQVARGRSWCFLFLNKVDMLDPMTATTENDAKHAYEPLRQRLLGNQQDVAVEVIVGSMKTGQNVPHLLRRMAECGATILTQ